MFAEGEATKSFQYSRRKMERESHSVDGGQHLLRLAKVAANHRLTTPAEKAIALFQLTKIAFSFSLYLPRRSHKCSQLNATH